MRFLIYLFLCTQILLVNLVHAAAIDKSEIEQWLASYQSIHDWSLEHREQLYDITSDFLSSASDIDAELSQTPLYGELNKLVQKNGFDSPGEWVTTARRIILAHVVNQEPGMLEQMEQLDALESMANDPSFPEQTREQLNEMLVMAKQMKQAIEELEPADFEAVKPFAQQIEQVMQMEQETAEPTN